ncbi:HDOD domain-containing protein [Rhodocaloribacter litoris]|uniref:HDOD domain-containing protein n=1 Tax=Rhodocaloribacter litoris TaxID=2558931 RepID=UPI00141DDFC1|nr:HDOD domain-containing protein [Rhodocaloribacter litoris]QXD15661.1 HDOD domain-containing protein [Rhodocaloribacter litoris]
MALSPPKTATIKVERQPDLEVRFPPLPRTVTAVSNLLAQRAEVPDTPELVRIIHNDPVIAAAVLRRVNSAYFGVRRHVSDVKKAVYLLGFVEVCNIVLSAAMMKLRDVVSTEGQVHIFDQIMQSSVGAASYAREIASFLHLPDAETAFTAGLLHNAGRLVFLYNRPDAYERLWMGNENGLFPPPEAERALFGLDHMRLGHIAANHWELPHEVGEIIGAYLTPGHIQDPARRLLALTVAVAASATEQLCMTPGDGRLRFEAKTALRILARSVGRDATELIELIESKREPVTAYIALMTHGA